MFVEEFKRGFGAGNDIFVRAWQQKGLILWSALFFVLLSSFFGLVSFVLSYLIVGIMAARSITLTINSSLFLLFSMLALFYYAEGICNNDRSFSRAFSDALGSLAKPFFWVSALLSLLLNGLFFVMLPFFLPMIAYGPRGIRESLKGCWDGLKAFYIYVFGFMAYYCITAVLAIASVALFLLLLYKIIGFHVLFFVLGAIPFFALFGFFLLAELFLCIDVYKQLVSKRIL